jgi:hypothetical protein
MTPLSLRAVVRGLWDQDPGDGSVYLTVTREDMRRLVKAGVLSAVVLLTFPAPAADAPAPADRGPRP